MSHRLLVSLAARLLAASVIASAAGALAQRGQGIFVTPIPNLPFHATVLVERTVLNAKGAPAMLHSTRRLARDRDGRIYNEFRPLVPASFPGMPPLVTVHLYDPRTRITSYLYPQQRTFTVDAVNHAPATDTTNSYASPSARALPQSDVAAEEDLGVRTIAGIAAHGVRQTQAIPRANSGSGKDIVITDEYWYSNELRINLEKKHDDPRLGSWSAMVTELDRTDPDPGLFEIPADYKPVQPPVAIRRSGAPPP